MTTGHNFSATVVTREGEIYSVSFEDLVGGADIYDFLRVTDEIAQENSVFLASCDCGCGEIIPIDESDVLYLMVSTLEGDKSIIVDWKRTTDARIEFATNAFYD